MFKSKISDKERADFYDRIDDIVMFLHIFGLAGLLGNVSVLIILREYTSLLDSGFNALMNTAVGFSALCLLGLVAFSKYNYYLNSKNKKSTPFLNSKDLVDFCGEISVDTEESKISLMNRDSKLLQDYLSINEKELSKMRALINPRLFALLTTLAIIVSNIAYNFFFTAGTSLFVQIYAAILVSCSVFLLCALIFTRSAGNIGRASYDAHYKWECSEIVYSLGINHLLLHNFGVPERSAHYSWELSENYAWDLKKVINDIKSPESFQKIFNALQGLAEIKNMSVVDYNEKREVENKLLKVILLALAEDKEFRVMEEEMKRTEETLRLHTIANNADIM